MTIPGVSHLLRLALLSLIALAGLGIALTLNIHGLEHSPVYTYAAIALLCFGLYMAVLGIDRREAIRNWRIATLAVTGGVFCKYLLIMGITYAVTHDWRYMVLSMAVAQIDPLSVAALSKDKRMTEQTRTILNLWASFDDPVTVLATPILLGIMGSHAQSQLAAGASWSATLLDLAPFLMILILVASLALWRQLRGAGSPLQLLRKLEESERHSTLGAGAALVCGTAVRLATVPAAAALVFRPRWLQEDKLAARLTNLALYGATLLLGILLAGGVDLRGGLVLGVATYASQIVVAWGVVAVAQTGQADKLSIRDVWHLALAQQNGITAIVLALNLEPIIPGSVAAISLAIVTINLINFVSNWLFDAIEPKFWPKPA